MTSLRPDWETPQAFYDWLNARWRFTLDPCATRANAKCARYFTPSMDGLSRPWAGRAFMNPPYGDQIRAWMRKARAEARERGVAVVCLVPARVDTKWWHDHCMKSDEVCFVQGRLRFRPVGGRCTAPTGSKQRCVDPLQCKGHSAPFPSAVVTFRGKRIRALGPLLSAVRTVGGRVVVG